MKNLSKDGRKELKGKIIDAINDGRLLDQDIAEIHHEVFNTDYFIIGYYQAEEWLKNNYGIFAAIERIKQYEQDNFGEVNTDLSNSETVVNMLAYILGEEILNECKTISDNWDKRLDEEMQTELLEELS